VQPDLDELSAGITEKSIGKKFIYITLPTMIAC
jgi:hypothetical protein